MEQNKFTADISAEEILIQNESLNKHFNNVKYEPKNYLDTRLKANETEKTLTIRLLPYSPEGGTPFHKIVMHTVRVNKELSDSGWKQFVCPNHNGFNKPCPYCETAKKAHELMKDIVEPVEKDRYKKIEYSNRARDMWVVRCIDRDHEADGVKFWCFSTSYKGDGVYDKIMNIFKRRSEQAKKKGKDMNIFSLTEGKDLEVTITRDSNNKSIYTIVDSDETSMLSDDIELANSWISDEKKWTDVYSVKPYDYLAIALQMKVPFYDKTLNKYVEKKTTEEYVKEQNEKDAQTFENNKSDEIKAIENASDTSIPAESDDLPF